MVCQPVNNGSARELTGKVRESECERERERKRERARERERERQQHWVSPLSTGHNDQLETSIGF